MGKSRITEQLANNEVTLDLAFNKLLLIASVINNKELLKWVEHEISGYQENDNLPLYRKNEKSMQFIYSGLNGTYAINSAPMPITYFSEPVRNEAANIKILEGVKIIERQLAVKDSEWSEVRDCTEYAGDVYANTGIQCFNIGQVLKKSHYEKVYNNIKVHLMKILLMIEKWFGTLDPTELETKKYERLKIAEAGKLISTYITGLSDNKAGIPNPRISMPNKAPDQHQNAGKVQQQAPVAEPQQMYQMPQQPIMPQMPPSQMYQMPQQPVMPPQQMYQMPQQPVMPPQQPLPQQPEPQQMPLQQELQQQEPQQMPLQQESQQQEIIEEQELPENVLTNQVDTQKETQPQEPQAEKEPQESKESRPQKASTEEKDSKKPQGNTEEKEASVVSEKDKKEEAAKAAEIRKDRIPKSLLDYLEEKKTELSKKTE